MKRLAGCALLSAPFALLIFWSSVFAVGPNCVDITGQTALLTPPDAGNVIFDPIGGLPARELEACISDGRVEDSSPEAVFVLRDAFTPTVGIELYPLRNFAWNENAGWLQFDWQVGGNYSAARAGVDVSGVLYGYVWNTNIGWIKLDWWRDDPANYPLGKRTPGIPIVDLTAEKPYPFKGYAWNDSLGWISLLGARTDWRPPVSIAVEKTNFRLDIPEQSQCKQLFSVPYLQAEIDMAKPSPTPLAIRLLSRPANIAPTEYRYRSTDPGATLDGYPIGDPQEYSKDAKTASYVWREAPEQTITINLNPERDPLCVNKIKLIPPFQYRCDGRPISYLPECDITKPEAPFYCQNDCLFLPVPTPLPSPLPSPAPSPSPAPQFCGNRKVDSGEQCDRGWFGGYLNARQYCDSNCKTVEKPQFLPKDKTDEYPWTPVAPFLPIDRILPANPATHAYDSCFCLLDRKGECLKLESPVKDIKVSVEVENTVIFDQGLENTRKIKCAGKITAKECGETLPVDLPKIYRDRYDKTPEKTYYGEAAVVEVYAKNLPEKAVYARPNIDDDGLHRAEITLNSNRGANVGAEAAKVCLRVRSYMPTSGANAYDENHNGVIDPGDHFYDDGENDLYRIRLKSIKYDLGGVEQSFRYEFEKDDGYYQFRAPLELTKLDSADGKDFILAIVEQASRFLAYVNRVVPEDNQLTHVPGLSEADIKIGVDRIDIGSFFWIDLDLIADALALPSDIQTKLNQRDSSLESPRKPQVFDDSFTVKSALLSGLSTEKGVECNLGLFCNIYLKPFYQTDSAKTRQINESKEVQLFSEISYTAKELRLVDALGKSLLRSDQLMTYLSNQFPRGKESTIANPLADIRGTISSSTGVYTRRANQTVISVGDLSTNAVRNAIAVNVNEIIRGSATQKNSSSGQSVKIETKDGKNSVTGAGKSEKLLTGKVLYTRENLLIGDLNTTKFESKGPESNLTLIVDGGDVFLDGNVEVVNARVGIIVLRRCESNRTECKGGNIYVAPQVTDVYANIFADGSLFSYDGKRTNIDARTGVPKISDGQRTGLLSGTQLLIKGSLSSQNTVGGSVGEKGVYLLGDGSTTNKQAEAVPYDLNHLRYVEQERTGGGSFQPVIRKQAKGLPAGVNLNEAIYVIYQAPPGDLPGFKVAAGASTGGQVNR